jgi:hypothetical protein
MTVVADNAKRSAARIAVIMLHNIAGDEGTD